MDTDDRAQMISLEPATHVLIGDRERRSPRTPRRGRLAEHRDSLQGGIDFRAYWRMILRRQLMIILLAAAAILGTIIWRFSRIPQYKAVSTILIEPQMPQVFRQNENFNDGQFAPSSDYDYYRTQFELLRSESLAKRVISDNSLENNPLFKAADRSRGPFASVSNYVKSKLTAFPYRQQNFDRSAGIISSGITQQYLARLSIEPVRNTRLVIVAFTAPDRELSAHIVNAHVDTFIRQGLELQAQTGRSVESFLQEKLAELKNSVEDSEATLNAYQRKVGIVSLQAEQNSSGSTPLVQRLTDLNSQLTQAVSKRIALETEHQMIGREDYDSLPEVISNPVVQEQKEEVARLSAQYAAMRNRFNPGYHPLDDLRARLIMSRHDLIAETKRVGDSVDADYRAALANENKIQAEIARVKAQTLSLNAASLQEAVLERQVDADRELYRRMLERMNEISVASEVPASNVSVVDRASPPSFPTGPAFISLLSFAVSAALFVGVALAILFESIGDGLKNAGEVSRILDLPTLGMVPNFVKLEQRRHAWLATQALTWYQRCKALPRSKSANAGHRELVVSRGVSSAAAEAYRGIRSAIMFSRPGGTPKSILITSSTTAEGKTVSAINIATALAQMGGRTLLIDTDFRRSRCHEILMIDSPLGLSDVLVRQSSLEQTVFDTQVPGLFFIGPGSRPPNPAELLASADMRRLVRQLSDHFDFVIMDSAPIIPVSDSLGLAAAVEAVLLVANNPTSRWLVRDACARLDSVGARLLGIVLNRVDHSTGKYSDSNYYRDYSLHSS
jgi:polysaccharide biosynthesis transport protein